MKLVSLAVVALVFAAPLATASPLRPCSAGTAACEAASSLHLVKQRKAPVKAAAPLSRRKGHNDDFYQMGLKS